MGGCAMSLVDFASYGSAVSLRSFARMGSSLSVLDFVHMGSTLSVRRNAKFGSDFFTYGNLYFSDTTYMKEVVPFSGDPNKLTVTVQGQNSMTLTSTGGTLHGTWMADTVVSILDRNLKDNILPLT